MSEGNKGKITTRRAVVGVVSAAAGLVVLNAMGGVPSVGSGEAAKPYQVRIPMITRRGLLNGRIETPPPAESRIGMGFVKVDLAYRSQTNLNDPRIKANVEEDIASVTKLADRLPVLGYPTVSLSAQDRYGYDFTAVNKNSIGTYDALRNYMFVNMEINDPEQRKHLIYHELGGHALDPNKLNPQSLDTFIDPETHKLALEARQKLVADIRRYKGRPAQSQERKERQSRWKQGADKNGKPSEELGIGTSRSASMVEWDAWSVLEYKFEKKQQVTWDEIVNASNVYAQEIWEFPTEFNRFKDMVGRDDAKIQAAADDELYGEFTAYILQAQDLGLFDSSYKHPVLELYWDLKKAAGQVGKK